MTKILNFQNENEVHFQNSTMRKYTEREVKQERVAHNSDCKDSKSPRTSNRSNRSTKKATMATIRRLSDKDVRSIFESLHHSRPPPAHLKFQIIPVASNGLKLSPPSYEFEDGLYVLLKPQQKGKPFPDYSKVPKHLMHLICEKYTEQMCPWSLSGPQFPQPTAIQQRYCYPKGNPEYSARKGGALWTMYEANGKEDMEFRLLHVYFSAKRAINKGAVKGSPKGRTNSPAAKRAKRDTKSVSAASTMTPHRLPRTRIPSSAGSTTPELTSPDYTASTRASSTVCQSPGSFATLPPVHHSPYSYSDASCPFGESLPPLSTNNCFSFSDMEYDDLFLSRSFHPVGPGLQYAGSFGSIEPEPAFHIGIMHNKTQSPPQFPHQQVLQQRHNTPKHNSNYDGDTHMQDADHEPLLDILAKPAGQQDGQSNSSSEVHFANQLDRFHNTVCEMIVKSPAKDQAALLSSYASWAKHVAKDPLQRGGGTPSSDNKMIKKEDY